MTIDPLEKALIFIRKKYTCYTPEIAQHLRMSQRDTDKLLEPLVGGELVSCSVLRNGRRFNQYRKTGVLF